MTGILQQPYPIADKPTSRLLTAIGISLFIVAFLYLFRPFGLHTVVASRALFVIGGYGLVTFAGLFVNLFLIPRFFPSLFNEERWIVLHELVFTLWIVLIIGIGNAIYSAYVFERPLSLYSFLWFQVFTLLVAVIPVSFIIILKQNRLLKKNQAAAGKLSGRMRRYKKMETVDRKIVTLLGESLEDQLTVPASDILFLNAADNYVEVHYLDGAGLKRKLIRNTLKVARVQLKDFTSFYRCHRSWIVNLDHVISVTGNAQGYRLVLDKSPVQVPVSRSLNKELDNRLAK